MQPGKHAKRVDRRGNPKQLDSSRNVWMLWFDAFPPPPTMACLLSWGINLLFQCCVFVLRESCSCPCSPAASPTELRPGSWGSLVWFGVVKCCISTWQIKSFSNFSLTWGGELVNSQIYWIYWKSCLLNVFIPSCCWLCSWQVLRRVYRNSKYLLEWLKCLRVI